MYQHAKNDTIAQKYLDKIRANSGQNSTSLTLIDALFNPQYRRATWINIWHMIVHELTGINVICLYSNSIFKGMQKNGHVAFTPRQGVYLIGFINFLSSFCSTQVVRFYGRRTLLLWGQLGMALMHAGVALFNI